MDDISGMDLNSFPDKREDNRAAAELEKFMPSEIPVPPRANEIFPCRGSANFMLLNDYMENIPRATDLLMSVSVRAELYKTKIISLVLTASKELMQMAQEQEPLWAFDAVNNTEVLNDKEYKKIFASLDATLEEIIRAIASGDLPNVNENIQVQTERGLMQEFASDNRAESWESGASRAIGIVLRNPISLVNMLMDVDEWSSVFSNFVSNATNLGVLMTGQPENGNGVLQVMMAEYHIPSPLVRTLKLYFARYCRQICSGTWLVVDVSLENIFPNPETKCHRKPSGCLIKSLQDGSSMVTWVEHNSVSKGYDIQGHGISAFAFSAKRVMSSLQRQYNRIAALQARGFHVTSILENNEVGSANLIKLAERIVGRFNGNLSSSMQNTWMPLPIADAQDILVKTSLNLDDPGEPGGVSVTIATTVWLPVDHVNVFDFLRYERNRGKWDILSYGMDTHDFFHLSPHHDVTNCISVVLVKPAQNRPAMLYLQEAFGDSSGYYVVFAPVDIPTMNEILKGGNTDNVAVLPSGFAILPGRLSTNGDRTSGCTLTIAFQIIDEELSTPEFLPPQSVLTAYRLMKETTSLIETAILSST